MVMLSSVGELVPPTEDFAWAAARACCLWAVRSGPVIRRPRDLRRLTARGRMRSISRARDCLTWAPERRVVMRRMRRISSRYDSSVSAKRLVWRCLDETQMEMPSSLMM